MSGLKRVLKATGEMKVIVGIFKYNMWKRELREAYQWDINSDLPEVNEWVIFPEEINDKLYKCIEGYIRDNPDEYEHKKDFDHSYLIKQKLINYRDKIIYMQALPGGWESVSGNPLITFLKR